MIEADKYKIELGDIKQHVEQKMKVLLTNHSKDRVSFSVWAGCGCTIPIADRYEIDGGQTANLYATFDAHGRGTQVKVFGIEYNDKVEGFQRLPIEFTANVL